jgi:hypothetical protein
MRTALHWKARGLSVPGVVVAICLYALSASASDAGPGLDGSAAPDADLGEAGTSDDAAPENSSGAAPLGCDGALCDTTNGAELGGSCAVASYGARGGSGELGIVIAVAALVLLRRRRSSAAGGALIAVAMIARPAQAEPLAAADVAIREAPPVDRHVTVEWNPLPLVTIGRLSANVVVTPKNHHSLIVSPFYAWATTNGISVYDSSSTGCSVNSPCQTTLPVQHFSGFGAELGYRYYYGQRGPRGFFLGPSLIFGAFTATAQNGTKVDYANLGGAIDVGYEMLVADRVALALGGGLQYTATTVSLPAQQFPAELYANGGLRPRLLLSAGWAF